MTTNDKLTEAQAALTAGLTNLVESDGWKTYLESQARFHNYSFSNVLWLLAQASGRGVSVSQFAGYQTWLNLGRHVRKGEVSFRVLAPCGYKKLDESTGATSFRISGFKAAPTFDISQTDGAPIPEVVTLLQGSSEELRAAFAKVAKSCEARGLKVERQELNGQANGYFSRTEKTIVVDSKLSDLQAFKTLCHETAHSLLHDSEEGDSRGTKEVEAESTAFVVLHALGLNSAEYSLGYVAVWAKGNLKLVQDVANRVQKTSKTIVTLFEVETKEVAQAA
jgi:antirestriction protein ArdC